MCFGHTFRLYHQCRHIIVLFVAWYLYYTVYQPGRNDLLIIIHYFASSFCNHVGYVNIFIQHPKMLFIMKPTTVGPSNFMDYCTV